MDMDLQIRFTRAERLFLLRVWSKTPPAEAWRTVNPMSKYASVADFAASVAKASAAKQRTKGQRRIAGLLPLGPKMPEPCPSTRRNSKPHGLATAAASVVLPAPAGTDRPYSAAGGLFEAEPCHRRWSRFPVSPSAGGASRLDSPQKARSHSSSRRGSVRPRPV